MNNGKLGICLIGCGRAGMIHGRNFINRVPGAEMVAVADAFQDAAAAAAAECGIAADHVFTDYRDAIRLAEVDVAVVVAPTDLHCSIVKDCAAAGKHIFCEKPMAMNAEECAEMIAEAKRHGVKLQIGFMRRHDLSFRRAKEALDSGAIGELVLVKSQTRGPSKPRPWMYDISQSNGILAEVNSHDIDSCRWFAGSDIASLYAVAGNFRNPEARAEYPDYYDNVVMTGTFRNGVQFEIDGAAYVQYGYDAHVELVGTKGVIRIGRNNDDSVIVTTPEAGNAARHVDSWRTLFIDAYLAEDISFINAIQTDTEPPVTGYDGLMAVKVVEAGNRSIRTGEVIRL